MDIIIATANSHKVFEIQKKFTSFSDIKFMPMSIIENLPEIEETGSTFSENALIKAEAIAALTDSYVLSDDSGLEIDALNGEPGIFSARYGNLDTDEQRYNLVLSKMKDIPEDRRTARFICSIAFIEPDGTIYTTEGRCEGYIALQPSGSNGFGYDPVFFVPEFSCTMAEINIEEKNRISHRAKALENFYQYINSKKMQDKL
ncbi:MAG: RdgB/HAM1 family non-canonical purine NTP pyrophosphatase [Spirochaetes bacterium]|nr:RdgB/HAM1 family non-canonical purine NTP pyrophosphatase [Spirochaetota bacterium]